MKVLIIGGAGFIGSNLAETLVKDGNEIIVLDNFFLGSEKNIRGLDIEVINGDIRDMNLLKKISKDVDIIYNQAAISSSPLVTSKLKEALEVNVIGFANILQAARDNNIKRVIYASTSSIYANNPSPLHEDMKVSPPNFYSAMKYNNEHMAILFSQEYGLETVGFRYMSIYGPKEGSKGIYANLATQFLESIKKNEQPIIYGDGTQTRDFTYVKDVVNANILAMTSGRKLFGKIFNVGTGKAVSLNGLVSVINKVLGKNIKPKYVKNEVKNYIFTQCASISQIHKILGYTPQYSLEAGIKEMS